MSKVFLLGSRPDRVAFLAEDFVGGKPRYNNVACVEYLGWGWEVNHFRYQIKESITSHATGLFPLHAVCFWPIESRDASSLWRNNFKHVRPELNGSKVMFEFWSDDDQSHILHVRSIPLAFYKQFEVVFLTSSESSAKFVAFLNLHKALRECICSETVGTYITWDKAELNSSFFICTVYTKNFLDW